MVTMALGEAWIEVRADLRPFTRDADRQVKDAADKLERGLSQALSNAARDSSRSGASIGDGLGRGISNRLGNKDRPPWVDITAAFAAALDDGISALPVEMKATIVAGILAALPVAGAALTGALVAAIGVGVAGVGIALGSQFQRVQDVASREFGEIRSELVASAGAFEQVLVDALIRASDQIQLMGPRFEELFNEAATFVAPLLDGMLAALEFFIDSLISSIGDVGPFIDELSAGIAILGAALGDAFTILISTGDDGVKALRDLIALVVALTLATAQLLRIFTELYGNFRDMVQEIPTWLTGLSPITLFRTWADETDALAGSTDVLSTSQSRLVGSMGGTIAATKKEEQALRELQQQMEENTRAAYDAFQSQIDFERSLDRVAEALRRSGGELDISSENGRRAMEELAQAIQHAQEETLRLSQTREMTAPQAIAFYNKEIERLREVARAGGVTNAEFDRMFQHLLELSGLEINPDTQGLRDLATAALRAAQQLERTLRAARMLRDGGVNIPWGGGFTEFAEGDIVTRPTFGVFGEDGPEVVIPLTKPQRAAQLVRQSGLDTLLQTQTGPVYVYIGNEQLDSRMYRVAQSANSTQGLVLAQGFRGF